MKGPSGRRDPRSERYVNRELSWLAFNERVLKEAANLDNPLLERLKFLAIFESNLDEFFMVRVSGLIEQESGGITETTPDGLTPTEQLRLIADRALPMRLEGGRLWAKELLPALSAEGIEVIGPHDARLDADAVKEHFERNVFSLCTPLQMEPVSRFPFISNRSLNLAFELEDEEGYKLARIKVPTILPRLVPVDPRTGVYTFLEHVIARNSEAFFPGVHVRAVHRFRVVRDADVEVREIEAADLITAVEQSLNLRRFGDPVLLEYEDDGDTAWADHVRQRLELDELDCWAVPGHLGFDALWELHGIDRKDLKYPQHVPTLRHDLSEPDSIFEAVRSGDVLLHHPYDSFLPVEKFVESASLDDKVAGLKMTLYRVGAKSPIVDSLLDAAQQGKQVAAMVELKARFDESNNLVWSRALEQAGVHVTYGFRDKKVHCKLCLIVRQDPDGVRTYAHIGTGNYNPDTARTYTDLGLFTCDEEVCQDVVELFNTLTGFSKQSAYRKLLVAPYNLREEVIDRIEREIKLHVAQGGGRILFKLNSLVDPEVIDALYEASAAGVEVKLAVRGICCLRPGVKGLSENVEVVSIVGRFLEHSRIYLFENGGDPDVWIGSADMMRRNLDRRIEVLVPVTDKDQVRYLRDDVLLRHFQDNVKAWTMTQEGTYERTDRKGPRFELQEFLTHGPASNLAVREPE